MPLVQTVAGRYIGTVTGGANIGNPTGADIGLTDDNGYELSWTTHGEMVNRSDAFAQTILDWVSQGADWRLRFRSIEWRDSMVPLSYPWGGVNGAEGVDPVSGIAGWQPLLGALAQGFPGIPDGTFMGSDGVNIPAGLAVPGNLASEGAFALTLSATPGSPAASFPNVRNGRPNAITANQAMLSPNVNIGTLFTTKARQLPLEFILLPYSATVKIPNLADPINGVLWFITA